MCQVARGDSTNSKLEKSDSLRRHYPDQVVRVSPDASEDSQPFQRLPSDNQTLGRLVQRVNELCCGIAEASPCPLNIAANTRVFVSRPALLNELRHKVPDFGCLNTSEFLASEA